MWATLPLSAQTGGVHRAVQAEATVGVEHLAGHPVHLQQRYYGLGDVRGLTQTAQRRALAGAGLEAG